MFTDIDAAIEEAFYRRNYCGDQKRHYGLVQKPGGFIAVRIVRASHQQRFMWTTMASARRDSV